MPVPLFPSPKQLTWEPGAYVLPRPLAALTPGAWRDALPPGSCLLVARDALGWAPPSADGLAECYELRVTPAAVTVRALGIEGLLRAEATLGQLLERHAQGDRLPCCTIRDWPDFRRRCAADWLLNCEINRWSYDWGDGSAACLARLKRKLDFCFAHKINQVWFDGFGWAVERATGGPGGYAHLARECNRYARERGIQLVFAGYGGGYGTAYQHSELYRLGYQGQVFWNRRPWPDGPLYDCVGAEAPVSRQVGTCPSNAGLRAARIADLRQFVQAVEPGLMYIHDIDAGNFEPSRQSWLMRCDDCRRRWPSDELTDPRGQAGAYAEWFRAVAEDLFRVRTEVYDAPRDLTLVFTSPVYTTYNEPGQPELWAAEVAYFRLLSELIGPQPNVLFGVREQFYRADGAPKIAQLRQALDEVGHGHGAYVIAFGGGDNYTSDDLYNLSGAVAPVYRGATAVCVSNGGVHEEPVQVLNAELLWNSAADGFSIDPGDNARIAATWSELLRGTWRPAELCGPAGYLAAACRHLWGEAAGDLLHRARLCGTTGEDGPVARVWWSVTREIRRLTGEYEPWNDRVSREVLADRWARRVAATREALALARQAAQLNADEDITWFARCLEVGLGFAEVLAAAYGATGDTAAALARLERLLAEFTIEPTDVLGGDPGCWHDTLADLRQAVVTGASQA